MAGLTSDSVSLSWSPPPFEDQNGIIQQYILVFTHNQTGYIFEVSSDDTSINVSGLTPFTTYICAVAAQTIPGTGPYTAEITFDLPEGGKLPTNITSL